ncbi:hypothetical protein NE236_33960 [Actinoallomurus purpureus]|uniref:hypothetical protein n=1 Tax=Actinoallomurus purpureus TaxID=478114 RepID=UPI0020933242|nr:hypothetical protein [Actinoallomurus purpureus]MCO6009988.1 hypothetical protein [Actinoallomurus purpureus]
MSRRVIEGAGNRESARPPYRPSRPSAGGAPLVPAAVQGGAGGVRELPGGLGDLPRLEKLDLRWTKLDRIPGWVERLRGRGCVVLL